MISGSIAQAGPDHARNGWMLEGDDAAQKLRISLQQIAIGGTWYPGHPDRPSGSFYLRGGIRLAWATIISTSVTAIL